MLNGDLGDISLVSLLQIIESENKNAELVIHAAQFKRCIFFKEGQLVFIFSDDPRDFLGHFLVSQQIITEEDLAKAIKHQGETKEFLGEVLTKMLSISQSMVEKKLAEKIKESFYQLFLIEKANFTILEKEINLEEIPFHISLKLQPLIMEGAARIDDYNVLKKKFPSELAYFKVKKENIEKQSDLTPSAQKILGLLEKKLTIEELCLHFHTYEFIILRHLDKLQKLNLIENAGQKEAPVKPKPDAPDPIQTLFLAAGHNEKIGEYGNALEIYTDILKLSPANELARRKFHEMQQKCSQQITQEVLSKSDVLKVNESPTLNQAGISATEGFILSRINGQWSVEEIISVVPMPEAEVLKAMKTLLQHNLIQKIEPIS